jgi:hypothetical protein
MTAGLWPGLYTMCPVDTATAGSWAGVGLVNWPQKAQEDILYHVKKGMVCQFLNGKVCPPATSEAGARRAKTWRLGVFPPFFTSWPSSSGLRGRRRTYLTIFKRAQSANYKMVIQVLVRPLRPELDGQDVEASSREGTSATFR